MSLKNFVDTDIIRGNDKPQTLLSVAALQCAGLGSDLLCSEADLELPILQHCGVVV